MDRANPSRTAAVDVPLRASQNVGSGTVGRESDERTGGRVACGVRTPYRMMDRSRTVIVLVPAGIPPSACLGQSGGGESGLGALTSFSVGTHQKVENAIVGTGHYQHCNVLGCIKLQITPLLLRSLSALPFKLLHLSQLTGQSPLRILQSFVEAHNPLSLRPPILTMDVTNASANSVQQDAPGQIPNDGTGTCDALDSAVLY